MSQIQKPIQHDRLAIEAKAYTALQAAGLRLFSSSIGCIIAETSTLPFDVTKTRLQVSIRSNNNEYVGMIDCGLKTYRNEGFQALFKGLDMALVRQVGYTGLAFVLFEPIKGQVVQTLKYISNTDEDIKNNFVTRVLSGGTAGAVGITVFNPTEVLKTQLMSNRDIPNLKWSHVMKNVYQKEGFLGFYSGLRPNITRAFLINAAEIGVYDHIKNELLNHNIISNDGIPLRVASSFGAGIVSTIVSTPVDVVKTIQMDEAGSNLLQGKGMFKRIFTIGKNNGIKALYSGWQPILVRKVLWCTAFFLTYDSVREAVGLPTTD